MGGKSKEYVNGTTRKKIEIYTSEIKTENISVEEEPLYSNKEDFLKNAPTPRTTRYSIKILKFIVSGFISYFVVSKSFNYIETKLVCKTPIPYVIIGAIGMLIFGCIAHVINHVYTTKLRKHINKANYRIGGS